MRSSTATRRRERVSPACVAPVRPFATFSSAVSPLLPDWRGRRRHEQHQMPGSACIPPHGYALDHPASQTGWARPPGRADRPDRLKMEWTSDTASAPEGTADHRSGPTHRLAGRTRPGRGRPPQRLGQPPREPLKRLLTVDGFWVDIAGVGCRKAPERLIVLVGPLGLTRPPPGPMPRGGPA
jgi:hypothetical protein